MAVINENTNINDYLKNIYHNVALPSSFSGQQKLFDEAKKKLGKNITMDDIKQFLKGEKSFTLHDNVPRTFRKRQVIVQAPGILLSCDLAEMQHISQYNSNVRYLLFLIDCFSRKLEVIPLLNKKGLTVAKALEDFLKKSNHNFRYIWSDEGTDFWNKNVQKVCEKHNIKLYHVFSRRHKACICERSIRTIKHKMSRIMTHFNTYNYITHLPKIILSYNNSPHRSLMGKTPNEVDLMTNPEQLKKLLAKMISRKQSYYGSINSKRYKLDASLKNVLALNSYVRLLTNSAESKFAKSYSPIYTTEIFQIDKICKKGNPIVYYLRDLNGEKINGLVYRQEIKECLLPDHFDIEKILKSRINTKTGVKELFVKYDGYPDNFNEWRAESSILAI